jgi:hypothetical protein
MPALVPITQKQTKIEISALQGIFWTSIKGGKLSYEEETYNDGVEGLAKTYSGMAKIEPITISKPYDPVNDGNIQKFITDQKANRTPFSVTSTPVNADLAGTAIQNAKAITYNNCVFMGYNPPQFDRDGSGIAKVELMFAVNSLPSYATA